ncbi:MAG: transposase, partial [Puniceicoccales bacterium]
VSDAELVRRYRLLYPQPTPWQPMRAEVLEAHLKENLLEARELREELLCRMHNVSEFMRTLKLRFSLWFNRSRDRFGPLWSARFKSVLVEGDRFALRTVAAYIDLNAVRAGLVEDPKDYRFCGYAEALAGGRLARAGLSVLDRDLIGYRQTLYGYGAGAKPGKVSISRDDALRVLEKEKGRLPFTALLRCRVRYFSDGMVLGSENFVREYLKGIPPGKREKTPHAMRGADWRGLSVGTSLRKDLFG